MRLNISELYYLCFSAYSLTTQLSSLQALVQESPDSNDVRVPQSPFLYKSMECPTDVTLP
jgi:hypothetical protein